MAPPSKHPFLCIVLVNLFIFSLVVNTIGTTSSTHKTTTIPLLPTARNEASIMTLMMPKFIQFQPSSLQSSYPYKLYLYKENQASSSPDSKVTLQGFPLLFIPQAQSGSYADIRSLGATLYELNGHADYRRETYTNASYINQMSNDMTSAERFGSNDTQPDDSNDDPLIGFDLFTIDFNDAEWSNFHSGLLKRQEEYIGKIVEFILKGVYKGQHEKLLIVSYNSEHGFENIADSVNVIFTVQAGNGKLLWNAPRKERKLVTPDTINILGTSTIPHIFSNMDKSTMKWSKQLQQVLSSILLSLANSGANSEHGKFDLSGEDGDLIVSQFLSLKSSSFHDSLLWDDKAPKRENIRKATFDNKSIVELELGKRARVRFGKQDHKFFMIDIDSIQTEVNTLYILTNFYRDEVSIYMTEDHVVGGENNGPSVVSKSIYKLYEQQITLLPYLNVDDRHLEVYNENQKIAKVMVKIPNLADNGAKRKIYVKLTKKYTAEQMSMGTEEVYPDRFVVASPHPGTVKESPTKDTKPFIVDTINIKSVDFWTKGISIQSPKPYIILTNLPLTFSYKLSIHNQCENGTLHPVVQLHYGGMFEFESQYIPLRDCGENVINLQFLNLTDVANKDDEKLQGIALYLLNTYNNQTEFHIKIQVDYLETFVNTIIEQHIHTLVCDLFTIIVILLAFDSLEFSTIVSSLAILLFSPLLAILQYQTMGQVLYSTDFNLAILIACFVYSWVAVVLLLLVLRVIRFVFGVASRLFSTMVFVALSIALFASSTVFDPALPFILFALIYFFKNSTRSFIMSALYILIATVLMGPSTFSYIKEWNYWIGLRQQNQTIFAVLPSPTLTRVYSPLVLLPFYVGSIVRPFHLSSTGFVLNLIIGLVIASLAKIETFYILPILSLVAFLNIITSKK